MNVIHSSLKIVSSELHESPARLIEQAGCDMVAVLKHTEHIVSTRLMRHILDQLANRALTDKASDRLATLSIVQKITLDDL